MIFWIFSLFVALYFAVENPAFEKLFLIVFENERLDHVLNDWYMGEKLLDSGRLLTDYRAVTHPSQPNYIAMISGSTFGIWNDNYHDLNAPTIVDLLEEVGLSWKTYHEDYPGNCFVGSNFKRYVRKHNPFISFVNISTDPDRCSKIVNSDELEADIYHNRTANFVFFVPNLDDDGHDTNYTYASKWLEAFMQNVANHPNMQSTLFMITFDEDDFFPYLWKRAWRRPIPWRKWSENRVYTLLLGKGVTPGTLDNTSYNHYSILATLQDQWGLSKLGTNDEHATPFRF
jgi:acid phosphatase